MSLDKFGRSGGGGGGEGGERKRLYAKGPRGIGFDLTEEGDYDMDDRRLTRVGDAESETDAVNVAGLNRALKEHGNDTNAKLARYAQEAGESLEKHTSFVESRLNEQRERFSSLVDELNAKLADHVANAKAFERSVNETVYGKQHVKLQSVRPEIVFSETRDEYSTYVLLEDESFEYAFPYDEGFVSDWTFVSPTDARIYVDGAERSRDEIIEMKKGTKLTFKPGESALKNKGGGGGVVVGPSLNVSFVLHYPIRIKT